MDETNPDRWIELVRPNGEENGSLQAGWRTSLGEAIPEARRLQPPILLGTMNGHPPDWT
ncbi:MAG: hypothetical protein SNJ74_01560 [Fimbriimonadaceae bacterium]